MAGSKMSRSLRADQARAWFHPLSPELFVAADQPTVPVEVAWHPVLEGAVLSLPAGSTEFWGIPFDLAPEGEHRWLWMGGGYRSTAELSVGELVDYVVLAHFCGASRVADEEQPSGVVASPGEDLAEYVLVYDDGKEHRQSIRRRFEINDVLIRWGQLAFESRPHRAIAPREWRGPHRDSEWGENQMASVLPTYFGEANFPPRLRPFGDYWIYALPNPRPAVAVAALRLESQAQEPIGIGGITLVRASGHPLRQHRLVTLLVKGKSSAQSPAIEVDMGGVARVLPASRTTPRRWTAASHRGWGAPQSDVSSPETIVQIFGAEGATISVGGADVALRDASRRGPVVLPNGARIRAIPPAHALWKVEIRDADSGRLMPARVHFQTRDGLYLPPVGHRQEVNDRWFEDYGADAKLGATQYAYVPGEFEIRLPPAEVFAEVVRGFEYAPLRSTFLATKPRSDPVILRMNRFSDLRAAGWVSADTHVHFLSPETAWLEAQAEDLNIVNLLATQWGDLFTNVGDYTGELSRVSRNDTLIFVGTENRQHMLGHLSSLGTHGSLTGPLCAAGPKESYLGDPTWTSLAEWAADCRDRKGLAIIPHFPNPLCENLADVILGRVDALEIRDFWTGIETQAVREWYRLLNCGYRIPIVGGTDKMSAGMPVGGVRTYASVGEGAVRWDAWAAAVRAGRTFTTSGPLINLKVDDKSIGDEVRIGSRSAIVKVEASAVCASGLDCLEIVQNGHVVAEARQKKPQRELNLQTELPIEGSGWMAARCISPHIAWHEWPIRLAAHTSPVYLVGRPSPCDLKDILYLQTILEGGLGWLRTLATPADGQTQRRIEKVFTSAIRSLGHPPFPL